MLFYFDYSYYSDLDKPFIYDINLVNNRVVICEEVLSRRYSPIPRLEDRGKLFLPFVVLSENYGLARIIRRRFSRSSGWMGSTAGLRQIETNRSESRTNAEEHQREGEKGRERKSRGNDDAEVEKLPLGEGIGQERASGRQIKRSDGVRRYEAGEKGGGERRESDETQKRDCASIREIETVFFIFQSLS